MRKLFASGVVGLILLEIASIYFIMPLPGSQRMRSIDLAFAIYTWRWWLRAVFGVLVLVGTLTAWRTSGWRRWLVPFSLAIAAGITWVVNFRMAADQMFRLPTQLIMAPPERSTVARDRLIVGIEINGDARAYPLQFIGYHHQVRDTVGGQDVLVSYCTVCRTGRVFIPAVGGTMEQFRLVGMDHFNAMLEDRSSGSWWRQANGEAVVGRRKGETLPEIPSRQVTLEQWLALYPRSLIMQGDPVFADEYAKDYAFERGTSRRPLTGTDTSSWDDKSWVVGLTVKGQSKAYDWNRLKRERIVHDELGGVPVLLVLGADDASFFAFERPDDASRFELKRDSLFSDGHAYALSGRGASRSLELLKASQEFWHSWRTFQPGTERY
ncbi:MAG: DUF3179 domain-containing (seleno)protein [Gemmatimonadaceae bacterium]